MPEFLAWPAIKAFFGGAFSAIWSGLKSFFGSLNAQGWIGLIGCALLMVGYVHQWGEARHWHKQSDRNAALYQAELAHEARIAKQAVDLKAKIDGLTSSISATLKDRADAENSRIAADADRYRLSGPGKAVCHAISAAAPVHADATSASADARPQMPADDRAAVPWSWVVGVIEEHDELLAKVQAVEEQHRQLEKAWPKDGALK